MNNVLSKVLIFTAGAAIGSVVTLNLVKTKYEKQAQQDIEEVRAYYDEKYDTKPKTEESEEDLEEPDELQEYKEFVEQAGYSNQSNDKIYEKEDDDDMATPYIIPPEEYDENGYETMSFRYYADGVLVDETGEPVKDIAGTVGEDFAEHFGEYEDDSVFVRNDEMKVDFEILRDEGCYSENR